MNDKPRCVMVDDDHDFLSFARHSLSRLWSDAEVIDFTSPLDALEFVTLNPVDLVVTDVQMPTFDGLRLTSAIRSFDPAVRILVMSGQSEARDLALERGANGFVAKHEFNHQLPAALNGLGLLS